MFKSHSGLTITQFVVGASQTVVTRYIGSGTFHTPPLFTQGLRWFVGAVATSRQRVEATACSLSDQWKKWHGRNDARIRLTFNELVVESHAHTHPLNGPFSGTAQVSRYQKFKTSLDCTEARDSEWQWHQLGHMQVCTSLQTDNHTSTPPLSFFTSCRPTNSVKTLKA